jgi:hypothetical protein
MRTSVGILDTIDTIFQLELDETPGLSFLPNVATVEVEGWGTARNLFKLLAEVVGAGGFEVAF